MRPAIRYRLTAARPHDSSPARPELSHARCVAYAGGSASQLEGATRRGEPLIGRLLATPALSDVSLP
jgi:hypothetical protein